MVCALKDAKKGSAKNRASFYYLSFTVTGVVNARHGFRFSREPECLLSHDLSQLAMMIRSVR